MANLASVDYANQRLHCHLDTVSNGLNPVAMYQEFMVLWLANASSEQNYYPPIRGEGNESIGGGLFTPQRADLRTGWKIVPYDSSHVLTVEVQVVNKTDGLNFTECFDRSTLTSGVEVDIEQGYQDVEIREVATGGALTAAQDAKLTAINTVLTGAIEGSLDFSAITRLILSSAMNDIEVISDDGTTRVVDFKDLAGTGVRFRSSGNLVTGMRAISNVDGS